MAFIIPDKLLETLICDSCHKYLSVKPIKVFPNRRIKCGRCCRSKNQSDGVVSLYGVVADKCLFKCINRFDGCRTLLTYSQVKNHEKTCLSKQYKCPVCPESLDIQTFLMGKHFRENHKSLLLDNSGVSFNLDTPVESPARYFYQQSDGLFFLFVNINQVDKKIELSFFYLGDSSEAKNVYQQFTVRNGNDLDIKLKPKPCYSYLSTDCEYISVTVPNTTCSVLITFSIIFKDEKLIKLSEGISLSATTDIIEEPALSAPLSETIMLKNTYVPLVKKSRSWKISLTPEFLDKVSIPFDTAFIFENYYTYFRNCSNCGIICCGQDGSDKFDHTYYWSKKLNDCICYYCFQFLDYKKVINKSDYNLIEFNTSLLSMIKVFCRWCGVDFVFINYWKHDKECLHHPWTICPDCSFENFFTKIITHLKVHTNAEIPTSPSFNISICSKIIYVYFDEGFVSLGVFYKNCELNLKVQMVPSVKGNRDHEKWKPVVLLFDLNSKFLLSFENSLTLSTPNAFYKVKIIVTEV